MITVVPRLPGQSPSTPVAPRTCTKQPGVSHAGCVALKLSSLVILWGSLTWTGFTEDLLMCSYTRYVPTAQAVSSPEA